MMRIKDLRRERGETQESMAVLIGITRGAYANIENGKREPDIKTMTALASHFGVTIDYLMGFDTKREPPAQNGELSERDMRLIKWFRSLPPEKQRAILIAQDGPAETAD